MNYANGCKINLDKFSSLVLLIFLKIRKGVRDIPKGKISNPKFIKCICQYCGNEFDYYRTSSTIRKSCYNCIPEGKEHDAALIRRLIKQKAVEYKGSECYICKKHFPNSVYDFHHLDPQQKDFSLGEKNSTVKWEKVIIELDKCILVCANCHRLIHAGEVQIDIGNDIV